MKNDFLTAYRAGKQAVEDLGWRPALYGIAAIILLNVVEKWLVAHYSFSRLKSFLISLGVILLAGFLFGLVEHATRSRRNQQAKR